MRVISFLIIFFLAFGCNDISKQVDNSHQKTDNLYATFENDTLVKLYDGWSINLPKGWRFAINDTFSVTVADATNRFRFHNRNGKLVHLEYGAAWAVPSHASISNFARLKAMTSDKVDSSLYLFINNAKENSMGLNSDESIKNISAFSSIYMKPKKKGKGITSIFIDSIGKITKYNIAGMNFFAFNLDSIETAEFEKISQSIVVGKIRFD